MRKMKRFVAITLLAAVMCLNVPQAFAGEGHTPGKTGTSEAPGVLSLILLYLDGVLISD